MNTEFKTIKAVAIGEQTLIGTDKSGGFPIEHGNCFSMDTKPRSSWREDGGSYRIVNFCVENLRELIALGIGFPFDIHPISERHAVMHDARIPPEWYDKRFCEICCPSALLPIPQQLSIAREIAAGYRVVNEHYTTWDKDKKPRLPGDPPPEPPGTGFLPCRIVTTSLVQNEAWQVIIEDKKDD